MLRRWCIPLAGLALAGGTLAPRPAAGPQPPAATPPGPPSTWSGRPCTAPRRWPSVAGQVTPWNPRTGLATRPTARPTRSISASWVEPTGHCTSSRTFSSFWVGLDGFGSKTVEQTGSEVDCSGGHARYFGWYEMFPAFPVNFGNAVRPGDHFTGSVTFTGGGHYTLVLKDTTAGWSHTVHKTLASAKNSSAEVIAEAPSCVRRHPAADQLRHRSVQQRVGGRGGDESGPRRQDHHGERRWPREGLGLRAQRRQELQREVAAQHLMSVALGAIR